MLENFISGPDLSLIGPNLGQKKIVVVEFSALLDVRHCPKLQFSAAISRKTNDTNLRKWQKS